MEAASTVTHELRTAPNCPGTERWLSARSVRGLGNAPGEAVELRLKQGRINHPRLRAGE